MTKNYNKLLSTQGLILKALTLMVSRLYIVCLRSSRYRQLFKTANDYQ